MQKTVGFFSFKYAEMQHPPSLRRASALSTLAGSHTERRTVGQAARCETLSGLRQQLCKGLLLQPPLADSRGSRRSDVENHTAAPFLRPPGRLLAVSSSAALPNNRSGVFYAHIKICSICRCAQLSPGSPCLEISIFLDCPAIWLEILICCFSFNRTFLLFNVDPGDAKSVM